MIWLRILVGIALLVLGRRLFWLFVALIGFVLGTQIGTHFFHGHSEWIILIALATGVLGALVAFFLQWLAIGFVGFFAGAYFVFTLLYTLGWGTGGMDWVFFLGGGVFGLLLIIFLFDWALIILSSLAGAALVTEVLHFRHLVITFIFIVLFICGVVVQSRLKKR